MTRGPVEEISVEPRDLGKSHRVAFVAAAAAILALGFGIGFAVNGTRNESALFEATLRDVRAVHASIAEAHDTLAEAERELATLERMAADAPGQTSTSGVDALRAQIGRDVEEARSRLATRRRPDPLLQVTEFQQLADGFET